MGKQLRVSDYDPNIGPDGLAKCANDPCAVALVQAAEVIPDGVMLGTGLDVILPTEVEMFERPVLPVGDHYGVPSRPVSQVAGVRDCSKQPEGVRGATSFEAFLALGRDVEEVLEDFSAQSTAS